MVVQRNERKFSMQNQKRHKTSFGVLINNKLKTTQLIFQYPHIRNNTFLITSSALLIKINNLGLCHLKDLKVLLIIYY